MSVTGLCQVCESARARYSCPRCGRFVCPDHFDPSMGLCVTCARAGGGPTV